MRKSAILVLMILAVTALSLTITVVHAAGGWIETSDTSYGTPQTVFNNGQTIYVDWGGASGLVDVKLFNSAATVVAEWDNQPTVGEKTWTTPVTDSYYAVAFTAGTALAETNSFDFLVAPESVMGTMMPLIACFAAMAIFSVYRFKRPQKKLDLLK